MKPFLSWSGELSHGVAKALEKWLPYMIQSVQPFVSSDISKGDRWGEVLAGELKNAEYAIICVTHYNLRKPWMHFEAGALAKFIGHANVSPLLFRLQHGCIAGLPLAQFQSVLDTKDEIQCLVYSINNASGAHKLDHELLTCTFENWWPHLEADLQALVPGKNEETQTPFSWLYLFEDLQSREYQAEVQTVWIVTTDIFKHTQVVRQKMANWSDQVKCQFFVGEAKESDLADLEQLKKSSAGRVIYKNFIQDDFEIAVASDYVIINANPQRIADMPPRHMFLRVPVPLDNGEYWIIVDDKAAESFTDRFDKLWKNGRTVEPAATSAANAA
jgi:hypothetical protein